MCVRVCACEIVFFLILTLWMLCTRLLRIRIDTILLCMYGKYLLALGAEYFVFQFAIW